MRELPFQQINAGDLVLWVPTGLQLTRSGEVVSFRDLSDDQIYEIAGTFMYLLLRLRQQGHLH